MNAGQPTDPAIDVARDLIQRARQLLLSAEAIVRDIDPNGEVVAGLQLSDAITSTELLLNQNMDALADFANGTKG